MSPAGVLTPGPGRAHHRRCAAAGPVWASP